MTSLRYHGFNFWVGVAATCTTLFPRAMAQAGPLDRLTPSDRQAVETCLTLIRARQLAAGTAKGAFRIATNTDSAWIEQYFGLETAIALLATTDDPNSADAHRVAEYLTFYAREALKEPEGVGHNFDGPMTDPHPIVLAGEQKFKGPFSDYDSIDGVAGLFLVASARYYKLTGQLPSQVPEALIVSLNALNRVINDKEGVSKDGGFTWAFPNGSLTNGLPIARASYPKYQLSDTIEVNAGLLESIPLFQKMGKPEEAKLAQTLDNGIAKGIALFTPTTNGKLYFYLVDNGNKPYFNGALYPGVLANLDALSYFPEQNIQANSQVWPLLNQKKPDDEGRYPNLPQAPSEHWLIAATRVEPDKTKVTALRKTVADNAKDFNDETYLGRLAVTILALTGEPARYPLIPAAH